MKKCSCENKYSMLIEYINTGLAEWVCKLCGKREKVK